MDNMTDKRVETIARAIYAVSPAYYHGTTNPVPWDEAAAPYREQTFREAQAAISADPVTEDVKRLVDKIAALKSQSGRSSVWNDALNAALSVVESELKKWSGE